MPDQIVIESPAETPQLFPDWTYDDFCGEKPYKWLYQFKENPWVQNQMMARLQKRANDIKFKPFLRMWDSYRAMIEQKTAVNVAEYNTVFPNQPMQLLCKQYICDDYGIRYTNDRKQTVEVLSHPLMPTKRVINLDSGEEKLEISFSRGGRNWRSLIASKDALASAQKIIGLAKQGVAVNSENAKELVNYITNIESSNYNDLPQQNATSHLGWLPENRFAPYCEEIIYDGDSPEFKRMFDGFRETGSRDVWMQIAKDVRSGKSVPARIALAASFAAPLIKLMDALPFFVHLWGTQGCGKTVGLMLAASVWGNPEVGQYIKTFGGTKVSQEIYASFCGNVPIILDELQIISDRKTFDDIIYMLCEGVSKGRGSKDGGLQLQRHWASTIITSAEMPIVQSNSGGGAMVRTIEINYGGEPLFPDSRSVAETLKQNYGFAGKEFIAALASDETRTALREIQHRYYSLLTGDIQDKQVLSASILLAADKLADVVLFHDGKSLTVDEVKQFLVTKDQADVNARCYEWLCGYIASNPVRFEDDGNSGELWGKIEKEGDRELVYFIKTSFDKALATGGFSSGSFLTWAKRKGLLKQNPSRPDKLTVQRRFNGHLTGCVAVYMQSDDQQKDDGLDGLVQVEDDDMPF